jgi:hypothetical protein
MQSSEREASRKWEIKVEFSGITWWEGLLNNLWCCALFWKSNI